MGIIKIFREYMASKKRDFLQENQTPKEDHS